jgi:lipopolysaccharide/colanic/teichoic acid biosynthesis glycosyltransferase
LILLKDKEDSGKARESAFTEASNLAVGSDIEDPAVDERKIQLSTLDEWVDAIVAVILLVVASPLLLASTILVKLAHGGSVLWSGQRLGENRRPFTMYKIHTLNDKAESLLGKNQLTEGTASRLGMELRFGQFLRETHLDELPQLLNVIKGDMRLFGPRPIRREVYEEQCRHIPEYDRRFEVKPGLIGYSQVLSTHNSDKRIAKKLDNRFVRSPPKQSQRILFVFWVLLVLTGKMLVKVMHLMGRIGRTERRTLQRSHHRNARVHTVSERDCKGLLKELSEEVMAVQLNRELPGPNTTLLLETQLFDWASFRRKRKIAYCRTSILAERTTVDRDYPYAYILDYEPESPLNHYRIDKYFLRRSAL